MPDGYDGLEQAVHEGGLPGLAATSAILRRLKETGDVTIGGGDASDKKNIERRRARSRLFLHTGSQR